MKHLSVRSVLLSMGALLLICATLPLRAQLAAGPWSRFMGDNYSNGEDTLPGPAQLAPGFAVKTQPVPNGVPVVAPGGKVVISGTNNILNCYSSTGALLWTSNYRSGYEQPPVLTQYGTLSGDPPAIGSDNTVYVVASTSSTTSLLALDLNAPGPGPVIKWTSTLGAGPSGPFLTGSPVIGSDNTIYCITTHSASFMSPVYAFKQGASYNSIANLKWTWTIKIINVVEGTDQIYAGYWRQPILETVNGQNDLVLVGDLTFGPTYMNYQTHAIGIQVLQDQLQSNGSYQPTPIWSASFPKLDPTQSLLSPPNYSTNGNASLAPDGNSLIIPWVWRGTYPTAYYGVTCLDLGINSGIGYSWNSPPVPVTTAPTAICDTNNGVPIQPANPVAFTAAITSTDTYVDYSDATGSMLRQRLLANGNQSASASLGSAIGGQLPLLDSNNILWIGTNSGVITGYGSSLNVLTTLSGYAPNGTGLAIGNNNYIYLTIADPMTGYDFIGLQ
jgi:hypothetical protein